MQYVGAGRILGNSGGHLQMGGKKKKLSKKEKKILKRLYDLPQTWKLMVPQEMFEEQEVPPSGVESVSASAQQEQGKRGRRAVYLEDLWLVHIEAEEDGLYLYHKLEDAIADSTDMLQADQYYIQYQLPNMPFPINVDITNKPQVVELYQNLNRTIGDYFEIAKQELLLFARATGGEVVGKRRKELRLTDRANITKYLVDEYMASRLPLDEFNELMQLRLPQLKKEVYRMLPEKEKPNQVHLLQKKEKKKPTPEQLYHRNQISLGEYTDLKFPERREKRLADALEYPLPEESHKCIVCRVVKANISCPECHNKICSGCVDERFLQDKTTFLLIHHIYCLKFGKPVRQALPAIRTTYRKTKGKEK
mmetsp:Transcript_20527/g.27057  ORF Transcript_20527/g.27057 Transcript_20527/m.27057 type:complete len:364 (+) Transcript_20527:282-1373(+)